MTPWSPFQPESSLRANGGESRRRLQFFSFSFLFLLYFSIPFFNIYLLYIHYSVCLYACRPEECTRPHYRWLWATMWLPGIELRTFGRAGNALNGWAISPALSFSFLFFSFLFFVFPSFFPSFFLSFFLSFFCCFLFQEMVSLCMLGCPKTHSVNQAVLELKEICVWAEIKGMHLLPHTTARQRLHFLVTSGCPGLILSGDGSVLWMFANPDYVLPFNVMSLKH